MENELVEIVDDERSEGSSSSKLSSSDDDDTLELESQTDKENEIILLVPPPVKVLPPYIMSGQCAVQSKGVPKSAFHPVVHLHVP